MSDTVTLTEPLEVTTGLVGGTTELSIGLGDTLSVVMGITEAVPTFVEALTEALEVTVSVSGVSVKLVGRDLWQFNSFITKILERDSSIEKITAKQSRITKYFDYNSSVR